MRSIIEDLRYAARQLRRNANFTIAALLTIALGIGVNSALFSVANELLLRNRPGVNGAKELVWVALMNPRFGRPMPMSYVDFRDVRDQGRGVYRISAMQNTSFALAGNGNPEQVTGQVVSSNFFELLRTPMALGRPFASDEQESNSTGVGIVISYALWQRRFGGDSSIVGQAMVVNGQRVNVLGVAPELFNGPDQADDARSLWVPVSAIPTLFPNWTDALKSREFIAYRAVARREPGATTAQLNATLARVSANLVAVDPTTRAGMSLRPYSAEFGLPPGSERTLVPLGAVASFVTLLILFIALANVSNLLLGRGLSRRREIGIRLSLGASRRRVVQQLLTESVLLTVVGGALGLLLAAWSVNLVLSFALPIPIHVHFDWRTLTFTFVMALVAGIAFGVVPALAATRASLVTAISAGAHGVTVRHRRAQDRFVISQVSLALLLMVMSGLFLRSVDKAQRIDLGFDASEHVLAASFNLGLQGYSGPQTERFLDALVARATQHPGAVAASVTNVLPTTMWMRTTVTPEHAVAAVDKRDDAYAAAFSSVRPGYFRTIGIDLVSGRDFDARDMPGTPDVVIVSERVAERLWPHANAIGQRISLAGATGPFRTIVGVARDAVVASIDAGRSAMVYVPERQAASATALTLLVRSNGNSARMMNALRDDVHALDPNIPIVRLATLATVRDEALLMQRRGSTMLGIFGALALVLAAVGVHAVMAFSVLQRTREIGVRMALGAKPLAVVRMFVRRGMRLTAIGVAIGVALSIAAGQVLSSMLFGVTSRDVIAYAAGSAILSGVALVACWLPARRAARIDPLVALRQE